MSEARQRVAARASIGAVVVSALLTLAGFALGELGFTQVAGVVIWAGMFAAFASMISIPIRAFPGRTRR